jgi:hypothetical protein
MSSAFQANNALGTKGDCREGRCRHTITLDQALFEALKASAVKNGRSVSEEMAARLAASRQVERTQ